MSCETLELSPDAWSRVSLGAEARTGVDPGRREPDVGAVGFTRGAFCLHVAVTIKSAFVTPWATMASVSEPERSVTRA